MSSPSPPPNNPSPLTIGRTFLKQYYHVLTTSPDMIYKFYRPSSVLSHGEGNSPTVPTTLESLGASPASELKDRFFSWADSSGAPVRFELEHGAIDAQESVGGGILLVVTGHLYLGDSRKSFCHTFFLDVFSAGDSKKRQFYVHNDVLRFLQEEAPLKEGALTSVAEEEEEETTVDDSSAKEAKPSKKTKGEKKAVKANDQVNSNTNSRNGVDTIEEKLTENDNAVAESEDLVGGTEDPFGGESEHKEDEDNEINERESDFVEKSKDETKSETSNSKPPAGSWASMVARSGSRGNGGSTDTNVTTPPTQEPAPTSKEKPPKKERKESSTSESNAKGNDQKQRYKRDPESTLVIKNVPDGTKEGDIRILFEPFAIDTKANIIGITVAHRGLAFVDYDSTAPVLAALEKKDKFFLNKKQLEIGQKTADRNRNKGGNSSRSSSSRGRRDGNNNQRQRNNGGQRDRSSGRNQKGGAKN